MQSENRAASTNSNFKSNMCSDSTNCAKGKKYSSGYFDDSSKSTVPPMFFGVPPLPFQILINYGAEILETDLLFKIMVADHIEPLMGNCNNLVSCRIQVLWGGLGSWWALRSPKKNFKLFFLPRSFYIDELQVIYFASFTSYAIIKIIRCSISKVSWGENTEMLL